MKFSIIIATMNGARGLGGTLDSVCRQSHRSFEILIQDGGSTDGTAALAQARGDERIRLACEADTGIYDAWNKALARADGGWAVFLGAGDTFVDATVLERAAVCLAGAGQAIDFAYGDLVIGTNGRHEMLIRRSLRAVYSMMTSRMGLPFPSTFIRMSLLRERGFDPSFRIAGDFDFAAGCLTDDNLLRLPFTVSYMESGGISDRPESDELLAAEVGRVLENRVIPNAGNLVRGCVRHHLEPTCCQANKKAHEKGSLKRLLDRFRI